MSKWTEKTEQQFIGDEHNPSAGGEQERAGHYLHNDDGTFKGVIYKNEDDGQWLAYSASGYLGSYNDVDVAKRDIEQAVNPPRSKLFP